MSDCRKVILGGAPEGYDARLVVSELERSGRAVLHIARDDRRMAAMRTAIGFLAPGLPVVTFPGWDCLPYSRLSPNPGISAARMATLAALTHRMPKRFVLLVTTNAAMQRIPAREVLREASFTAQSGKVIDLAALRGFLGRMGYSQAPTVTEPGDYAIRGGLIDLFPPGRRGPVRLDLFGDVLENIRIFDPVTQRSTGKQDFLELAPASEVILDDSAIMRFRQNYRIEFGSAGTEDPLYEAVSAGRKVQGVEHWLPLFQERLETIFDYLPDAPVTLDEQVENLRAQRWSEVMDQFDARRAATGQFGAVYKPIPPEQLYLSDDCWNAALRTRRVVRFHPLAQAPGPGVSDAGGRIGRNFAPERQRQKPDIFKAVGEHIRKRFSLGPVVMASGSEGARDRLAGLLADEGLVDVIRVSDGSVIGESGLHLAVWELDCGFEAPGMTVISEQDILGERLVRVSARRRRAENFLTEARSLTPGELVVHVDHGIGRYCGLEVVAAAGTEHECLNIEFAGSTRLYLPVENIDLLSKYGQGEAPLDRLGGAAWQARKSRIKNRIRDMAGHLIRVAAERELHKVPVLEPQQGAWEAFTARFPYEETDDQARAISDVLRDLGSGRPMDRLVCGDVGFGKTEVAIRAAFVAAMCGVQVALVCPTTLLSRQHMQSFAARFRGWPLELRHLSRFVSPTEARGTRDGLAKGTIDIVIGTHALLAKGLKFSDLGLLIVDEEQRFGVAHKERLKQLRSDVHVLTLTATPIPRTLQMSLAGVRDLSIIETPPVDRLAVRTYICEFDPVTVREALLREHYRGGQSFFVVPRIGDLPEAEEFLREQVPEVSSVTVHGRMATRVAEERMNAFYDGRFDVLLATSIVESGLDIPSANTLVVLRADTFGLAQLYQIRGRVGRSRSRAYAYLTVRPGMELTLAAKQRLRVLGSLDSLGAGFSLATRDLDIRGAGNLLGEEQSGQIREVGYELYQSMLAEAVASVRSGGAGPVLEKDGQWAPQINLNVSVLIPENYIPDLNVRLGMYRRLSSLDSKIDLEGFAAELIDRFGKLPREVDTLLRLMRIKALCKRAGIVRFEGGPKGATIRFHDSSVPSPEILVCFVQAQNGLARIKDDGIVVRRDWRDPNARIKGAFLIARDLAQRVKSGEMP